MKTAQDIIAFVGEAAAAERLGIKQDAIRKALKVNRLPAMWYHALEDMAGRPLPRECFSFKGAA